MLNPRRHHLAITLAALAFAAVSSGARPAPAAAVVVAPSSAGAPSATGVPPITGAGVIPADPATELLHSATVTLTRGDYDTQLLRLPPDSRAGFGTNIDRINTLLRIMLVDKTLAHEARAAGLDHDPDVMRKINAEADRILAQAMMDRNQAKWEKAFDARPNLEEAARERWLTQPDKYRAGAEQVKLTQILFAVPKHTADEAKDLADAARAKILAGADMSAIAKAESDDPAAAEDGGRTDDWRTAAELDPSIARIAFSLKKVGEVSAPARSKEGYRLVRLDAKKTGSVEPFDKVKAQIIDDMRKEYVKSTRMQQMAGIRDDPSIVVNQPAVDALVVRIDPEILKKAMQGTPPAGATPPAPAGVTPPAPK